MKSISPIMMTVVASLGILSTGCLGVTDDAGDANALHIDSQVKGALDGPMGTGGTNGLVAKIYKDYRSDLDDLMQMSITTVGGNVMRTAFTDFAADDDKNQLLRYAIECALDDLDYVIANYGPPSNNSQTFYGEGILTSTQGWKTSGLTLEQREALHTCIITRLNPSSTQVPIFWSGPHVSPDFESGEDYPVEEAVWAAYQSSPEGPFVAHVWPSRYVHEYCALTLTDSAKTRVCGTDEEECDVEVHEGEDKRKEDCEEGDEGIWVCNGHAAIATRLAAEDFEPLWPYCNWPSN